MGDYNLTALSPRSFEQLIQALSCKIIGPHIVIFGDGPDGGREATFEEKAIYPSINRSWNGYGVLQAKFLQRPSGTSKDGQWLLGQLSADLNKFLDKRRKLRKPEYYIIATNIILSPVAKKGFKDKVIKLLRSYQTRLKLKEFDIWDYDKIRVFLDNNREVATSYAAWITSGDILSKILQRIEIKEPAFDSVLANFLQKELISDQFAKLEQAGHSTEHQVPLAAVFTDLPAYSERLYEPKDEHAPLSPGFVADIVQVSSIKLDPESLGLVLLPTESEAKESQQYGRYVLIGGPGQGKTTIGQYICQLFRAALLKERPRLSPDGKRAIHEIDLQCKHDNTQLPHAKRFPVRIVLSEFAKALADPVSSGINNLLTYILSRITARTNYSIQIETFRVWLSKYPWLLILDGLDEVPASSNREQVLNAITEFWIDCTDANADILVLATTRPQGYSYDFSPKFYLHSYLAPLSKERALHYGKQLVTVRYAGDMDRQTKVISRLKRASDESATVRLMRSPLQVTIMATLVDKLGQPPEERWSLFRDYYKVIYDREVERDIPAANILRRYRSDIDLIHYQTGLVLQIESERTGKTDAKLTSKQFGDLVNVYLRDEGHSGKDLEELRKNIIAAAALRLVFLVGLEADQVGFEIRSLQEFMAAEGLMQGSDEIVTERLRTIAPLVNWRPVFLFAAGKCYADRKHLRNAVYSIAAQLNEDTSGKELSAVCAGSQLALDILEDGSVRSQPKHSQILARLACRLMDLPPSDIHVRLGRMYQPELDSIYHQEIQNRLSEGNNRSRGSAWVCVVQLERLKVSWAVKYIDETVSADDLHHIFEASLMDPNPDDVKPIMKANFQKFAPHDLHRYYMRYGPGKISDLGRAPWKYAVQQLMFFGGESAVRVVDESNSVLFEISYAPIRPNWLRGLQKLTDYHSAWKPYIAAAKFLSSPSQKTLADALRAIIDLSWPFGTLFPLPWPIKACLTKVGEDKNQLHQLADKVERGELGDATDWIAAEQRWKSGIQIAEFDRYAGNAIPFDSELRTYGFPLCRVRLWGTLYGFSADRIERILARTPAEVLRWIASDLVDIMENQNIVLPENKMQTLVRAAADSWASRLFFTDRIGELNESWIETLDYLGANAKILYRPRDSHSEFSKRLHRAYVKNPDRAGLLRILAYLCLYSAIPEVPTPLLDYESFDKRSFRISALCIKAVQSYLSDMDIKELIRLLKPQSELSGEELRLIVSTLSIKTDAEQAINIVVKLLDDQVLSRIYGSRLIPALNSILRKRKSELSNSNVCSRLDCEYVK